MPMAAEGVTTGAGGTTEETEVGLMEYGNGLTETLTAMRNAIILMTADTASLTQFTTATS